MPAAVTVPAPEPSRTDQVTALLVVLDTVAVTVMLDPVDSDAAVGLTDTEILGLTVIFDLPLELVDAAPEPVLLITSVVGELEPAASTGVASTV